MINKSVDKAVADAVLEKAFADTFERELADLEKEELPNKEIPEKYKRIERRHYNKRMGIHSRGYTVFLRAAVCMLIFIGMGFSVMMLSPAIRASVWDSVIEFYEKYIAMDFSNKENRSIAIGEHTLGYVPKGYILGFEQKSRIGGKYRFVNGEGGKFTVTYYNSERANIKYDNENREFQKIQIGEIEAYFVEYDSDNRVIIWETDGFSLSIDGNLKFSEMKKIAENIY